jgi:hypothetical protein
MATQPQQPQRPAPPPAKPDPRHEAAKNTPEVARRPGAPFEHPHAGRAPADPQEAKLELDRARADAPIRQSDRTIADEQRERSEEIAAMGVEKYKQSIDMRAPEDRPKQVAGVTNLERDEAHERREHEPARR